MENGNGNIPPSHQSTPAQPEEEVSLATLKPSLKAAVPTWLAYGLLGFVVMEILKLLHLPVTWIAQSIADVMGEAFPYETWQAWVYGLVWLACLFPAIRKTLSLAVMEFHFTSQRINYTHGILNRRRDQVELSRIRDIIALRPITQRLLGLGTLRLDTVDRSHPILDIPGQKDVYEMKEWVNELNQRERQRQGYREFEGTQSLG
ncbi:PH domain-containing protein [Vreelandella rituensis]|nr:PH domain-containing protein [Halomonas rituensis]